MDPHSPEAVLEIEGEELPAFAKNPETVAEAAAGALLRADPHKTYGRKARKRKAPHKSSVILWAKERTFPCPGRHLWSTNAREDYVRWCEELNLDPVNRTLFGIVVRDEA